MAFIENTLEGDDTNWWAPNHSAVLALLTSCGLKITLMPAHEVYICAHNNNTSNNDELRSANNAYKAVAKNSRDER